MKVISWIAEKIINRVATMIGGLIVNKVETESLMSHIDLLESLEARAKKLECDGNNELAKRLRHQASELTLDKPGQNALKISSHLEEQNENGHPHGGSPQHCISTDSTESVATPEKRGRGRPRKTKEAQ